MASADLYGPALSFLVGSGGSGGDLYAAVQSEQPGLLTAAGVIASRSPRVRQPRQPNARALSLELVLAAESDRVIGIGWVERDLVFDLEVSLRMKDSAAGPNQAARLSSVTRALCTRYRGMTNLAITVAAPAAFVRAAARVKSADDASESTELARAVVELVLTFIEPEGVNT